jgi:hypothetical protein
MIAPEASFERILKHLSKTNNLLCKVFFFLFQNTNEKFGGKKLLCKVTRFFQKVIVLVICLNVLK